ncbi:MAG: hypothetical protein H0A75_01650 [Candidatus Methanofishera endochildressiae]|uniref:Uncharacterized protein n=1 Tax=Candidatus Methanofishera endochildressiae TaxID=2738884 RepID=A0A7Z0MN98_9GAMM|nr:hypothetical protein [Candidatus Methanofishera endochildressiae]
MRWLFFFRFKLERKPADKMQQADTKHAEFIAEGSDFLGFINIWNTFEDMKLVIQ